MGNDRLALIFSPPVDGWHWLTHDATGFFTLCLVLVAAVQAGLFLWQLKIMREGIEDTRRAAEAAKASAESAKEQVALTKMGVIDLERAYFAVGPCAINWDFVPNPATQARGYYLATDPKEVTALLSVTNAGRTAGTLKKVYGEFSQNPPIGDTPIYRKGSAVDSDLAIKAGESIELTPYVFKDGFTGPQFFWGYVEYQDIFKNKRTSRYCSRIYPEQPPKKAGSSLLALMAGESAIRH